MAFTTEEIYLRSIAKKKEKTKSLVISPDSLGRVSFYYGYFCGFIRTKCINMRSRMKKQVKIHKNTQKVFFRKTFVRYARKSVNKSL